MPGTIVDAVLESRPCDRSFGVFGGLLGNWSICSLVIRPLRPAACNIQKTEWKTNEFMWIVQLINFWWFCQIQRFCRLEVHGSYGSVCWLAGKVLVARWPGTSGLLILVAFELSCAGTCRRHEEWCADVPIGACPCSTPSADVGWGFSTQYFFDSQLYELLQPLLHCNCDIQLFPSVDSGTNHGPSSL